MGKTVFPEGINGLPLGGDAGKVLSKKTAADLDTEWTDKGVSFPGFGTDGSTACVGNDARLSDPRTPTAHVHGNITNGGLVGTTANLPLITGTGGIVQAGSFGTAVNTFCQGNDTRLSDARTAVGTTSYSVAVPTVLDSAIDFASVTISNLSVGLDISVAVHDTAFATVKQYSCPINYDKTSGVWQRVIPSNSTGAYSSNDFEVDVKVTTNVALFRIRRTLGSTVGTARITISVLTDPANVTVAAASATYTGVTGLVDYSPSYNLGTTAGTACAGNDVRLSDARVPTSHTHGNISNAGAIGSTAGLPVKTGTSGVLTVGAFGTGATDFAAGNHTHSYAGSSSAGGAANSVANALTFSTGITVSSGTTFDGSAAKTISVAYGATSSTACVGDDSRLSNARTPSAHASSHVTGGGDIIRDATASQSGLATATQITKLDGIATNANNYVHPTTDGNLHVLATGTTNSGKVLTAGASAGVLTWEANLVGNAGSATVLATGRTITIGDTGKSFNGSANVAYTLAEIGAAKKQYSYLPGANAFIYRDVVGAIRQNNPAVTGTLKIVMPITWNSSMITFDVTLYDYGVNGNTVYTITGYNYSGAPGWVNFYFVRSGKRELTVRLAHDGTNNCALIGSTATVWSYPFITVDNVRHSHFGASTLTDSDWTLSFITSETGITNEAVCVDNTTATYATNAGTAVNASGNAANATKLTNARTIQTNLASTSAASFDGTANITPGVTGTLPVANGGTGLTSLSTLLNTNNTLDTVLANGSNSDRTLSAHRLILRNNGIPTSNLGDPSIVEAALLQAEFSNKLWFYDPTKFTFEYTMNGTDWITDTVPTTAKIKNFTTGLNSSNVGIIPTAAISYRIRIAASSYFSVSMAYFYVDGGGHQMKVHVNRKNNVGTWVAVTADNTAPYMASPGHYFVQFPAVWLIPVPTYVGHSTDIEFVFTPTWASAGAIGFLSMEMWGGYPAGNRNIFTWDSDKNVTYPANLVGTALYEGANRVYSTNNNNIGTGATNYAAGNHTHNYLSNAYLGGQTLAEADNADNAGITTYYLSSSSGTKPPGTDHALLTLNYSAAWSSQMASDWRTNEWYVRVQNNTVWTAWSKLWHSTNLTAGTGSTNFCAGDDSRLSNSRTPTAHAASHITGDTIQSATASQPGLATAAQITKLDGIATNANNYVHPTGDGNLHVPVNGTGNTGKVLTAGSVAGTYTWETPSGGVPVGSAQYQLLVTNATPFGSTWTNALNLVGASGLNSLSYASASFVKMTGANQFALDTNTYSTTSHTHTLQNVYTAGSTATITSANENTSISNTVAVNVGNNPVDGTGIALLEYKTTAHNSETILNIKSYQYTAEFSLENNYYAIKSGVRAKSYYATGTTVNYSELYLTDAPSSAYIRVERDDAITNSDDNHTRATINAGELLFNDGNLSAAIKFSDSSNTALATTNKTIVGSINEVRSTAGGLVSFPGFGTSHVTAAYGDHTHAYQPSDAGLTSLAGLTYTAAAFVKYTGADTFTLDTNTYSISTHTHNYAGSSSAGGAANSVANALTFSTGITVSSGTTFDGSAAKTISVAYGTSSTTACVGDDSRLSNARTPSAHALIDTTGHSVSGLTTGHFLKATGATTYAFGAHGLTYTDVGAAASSHTHAYLSNAYLALLADANDGAATGITAYYTGSTNKPPGTTHTLLTLAYNASFATQIASDWATNEWYVRTDNGAVWTSWRKIWHDGNLVAGTGATNFAAGNHTHSDATISVAGFMSAADKTKVEQLSISTYKLTIASTAPTVGVLTGDIWIDNG
jgi:hypothetical protein